MDPNSRTVSLALCKELHEFSLAELISDPRIHKNVKLPPLYTIPTTAGTGGEVTPFATIWDHAKFQKLSLSGPSVFANTAIIDPVLTYDLPEKDTIFTGLDAINQAMESIWNVNATSFTIDLATRSLKLGFESLPDLMNGSNCKAKREMMAECSLLAGLAISQTRTALCHSISYPLTVHFNVPHGLACAFTMPIILRHNLLLDDGRFQVLVKQLIGEDATTVDLSKLFDNLHKDNEVCLKVREKVKNKNKLLNLIPEMRTPGRADNSLLNTNNDTLISIIEESWNYDHQIN